jgi:hypothetical protein
MSKICKWMYLHFHYIALHLAQKKLSRMPDIHQMLVILIFVLIYEI